MGASMGNLLQEGSGIIDINFLNVTISGDIYIGFNEDTAISLDSSIARVSGAFLLEHNTATTGGAIYLASESYVILTGYVNMTFDSNVASVVGGAIHVDFDSSRHDNYDCFTFYDYPDFFCDLFDQCQDVDISKVSTQFLNNQAPLGSAIYGSTYSTCPWSVEGVDLESPSITIPQYLNSFEPLLIIRPRVGETNPNAFNTLPQSILPEDSNTRLSVIPGKIIEVELGAFDQLSISVPLTVFSQVDSNNTRASIGDTNWYTSLMVLISPRAGDMTPYLVLLVA